MDNLNKFLEKEYIWIHKQLEEEKQKEKQDKELIENLLGQYLMIVKIKAKLREE